MAQKDIWIKDAAEGEDAHLRILNKPPDVTRLAWYRGKVPDKDHIIAFLSQIPNFNVRIPESGHTILNSDGSLLIKKVNMHDSGIYTVAVEQKNSKILMGYGLLRVYPRVKKPTLRASNTTVTENKDAVVFTCNSSYALNIQWFFNGKKMRSTQRMKLSKGYRRLTIKPVKREDAGKYQCKASNPISSAASVTLKLNVNFE
ncbi:carcinoembryonic antigen-related cell adhesion molecule 21-like [Artibeus jamaicensis]|uniref:carcinoembryonic antigen-related cell adhesion molecule 21-like n=1 Tax=Artibeus jamaicensis TaxID=9417 RepID=UPI00235A8AA2|nr:carcinoembryonic antigen-related cell adhesion molecule 21-like [Artibeus jamaicensis]